MESKFWSELITKGHLVENKVNYDVIIKAGEEEIYAHFIILRCQSDNFRSNLKEKKNGKYFLGDLNIPTAKECVYVKFKYDQGIELYSLVRHCHKDYDMMGSTTRNDGNWKATTCGPHLKILRIH
ncbi:hypothetical protein C1646_814959 [Rhizophagus diaphanus]|nr:hypothetical protein C1646_814959 [Rhizophagus diaphanus] [Rhizophagus sp. MUCL 43196]